MFNIPNAYIAIQSQLDKAEYGSTLKLIEMLQSTHPDLCKLRIFDGNTLLQTFVAHKGGQKDIEIRKEIVDKLVSWGSEVNILDKNGKTPLIWTVINNDLPMVKHLVEKHNADMRKLDSRGRTAIHWTNGDRFKYTTPFSPIDEFFMMHGIKPLEFIEIDGSSVRVRGCIHKFYRRIDNAKDVLIAFLGSKKRSPILKEVPRDIMLYLARMIYQTRGDEQWDFRSTLLAKR